MKKIKGFTEEEILKLLESTINRLAPKFVFDIYEVEDIRQEAFIIGLQCINTYKEEAPLGAYLYTKIKCRLQTFKRDNSIRYNVSCSYCTSFDANCENCVRRKENEQSKYNLLYPIDISRVRDEHEKNLQITDSVQEISEKEILRKIDVGLPKELREDYLKMRDGMYVAKKRRTEIELKIYELVDELND